MAGSMDSFNEHFDPFFAFSEKKEMLRKSDFVNVKFSADTWKLFI